MASSCASEYGVGAVSKAYVSGSLLCRAPLFSRSPSLLLLSPSAAPKLHRCREPGTKHPCTSKCHPVLAGHVGEEQAHFTDGNVEAQVFG